jgi:hypothetical protein
MNNTTTATVDTRPAAGAEAITTELTIKWEGLTADEIQQLAQQALIVKLQAKWRKDGIPSGAHEVNASDYRPGVRAPRGPASVETLVAKLTPEQRAALLAKLSAM